MPGESRNKRKWWHGTLSIKNRDSGTTIKQFTSIDPGNPDSNAMPSIVSAYSNNNTDCSSPVNIPVPAFSPILSPGYFLFRPTMTDLGDSVVDIQTYQEAINLNKRHIFEFQRNAAYDFSDISCASNTPNYVDTYVYETITNGLNSNVFRYPQLPLYSQIGCCQVELSVPGVDLPVLGVIGRATRVWYLTYNSSSSVYSLYSYDFALLSNALVFRGDIDTSRVGGLVTIFDITWIPTDDSMIALCSDGIRRITPGDATHAAILGDLIPITGIPSPYQMLPMMNTPDAAIFKCKIEYNIYDNSLYVFAPIYNTALGSGHTGLPYFWKFSYSTSEIRMILFNYIPSMQVPDDFSVGGFAFAQNGNAYCVFKNNLSMIGIVNDANFGTITQVGTGDLLAGMNTLSFAKDPDIQISENTLYTANSPGQLFTVSSSTGTPISVGATLNAFTVGAATTINGEDTRIQPFPFLLGRPHWLFMVDTSSTMATGNRISTVKTTLINMLRTYVRYGDKITILWFRNTYDKFTKELRTYADVNEVVNYINTYFIPSSDTTNFCNAFSNISQDFSDIKNIFIISDGTFDDCGANTSLWQQNLQSTISSIVQANSGVKFTTVGVNINSGKEKLQYIADYSSGTYIDW